MAATAPASTASPTSPISPTAPTAPTAPASTARAEANWARANPEPQVTETDDRLVLWNYPVGQAALAPAHAQALARFTGALRVFDPAGTRVQFDVRGHASASGEQAANQRLARLRAQGVEAALRRLGLTQVTAGSAGASQPWDAGDSCLALARNRRVEVHRFARATGRQPVPLDTGAAAPATGAGLPGAADDGLSAAFEQPFEAALGTLRTAQVLVDVKVAGKLKLRVRGGKGGTGAKAVLKDGRLSAEAHTRIGQHIKASLGLEEREKGLPKIRFGVQADQAALKPTLSLQADTKFVALSFELVQQSLPDLVLGDVTVSLDFTGQVKFDFGPSPAAAARLARFAAGGGTAAGVAGGGAALTAATAVGAVGVAAVINGGTALLAQQSREEGLCYGARLAWRDGAASRVALEIAGNAAAPQLRQRRLDWQTLEGRNQRAFDEGAAAVAARLAALDAAGREALRLRWQGLYAKGVGLGEWPQVREHVYEALGGHRSRAGDPQDVSGL